MERIVLVLLSLGFWGSLAVGQTSADPAVLYASANFVFTGRVEKIQPAPTGLTARFKVDQHIKGLPAGTDTLQIDLPMETRCHAFEDTHSYLVYGRKIGDALWVNPCDGSKLVSQAEADLRYIHTVSKKVSEQCNRKRLSQLVSRSPIVATAEVIGTEDSVPAPLETQLLFRPWCGLVATTEDAYYRVRDVLKGEIKESGITVEHLICWDTITVDGYTPTLSPKLFETGNVLLLFLKLGSNRTNRQSALAPFRAVYSDIDENCGAVLADEDTAVEIARSVRSIPDSSTSIYKHWLDEDVDCLIGADGQSSCTIFKRDTGDPDHSHP